MEILEEVLAAKRRRNDRLPIFLFGDERTAEMVPASVLKHANAFMHLFEDSPEFLARVIARAANLYLGAATPADVQGAYGLHLPCQLLLAYARPRWRRRLSQEPGRAPISINSSVRTRCAPMSRYQWACLAHCLITREPLPKESATPRASSAQTKRCSWLAARPPQTRLFGMERLPRAIWCYAIAIATSQFCTH